MPERRDAAAVDFAVRHVFEREAVVPEKKLLAEALKHGLGAVTVEGVRRAYAGQPLLVEERDGRRVVTTPAGAGGGGPAGGIRPRRPGHAAAAGRS